MEMNIGIAGAGIGGLAIASMLFDKGHRVSLFDQFETPAPQGSGLVIQPVGQHVLDVIGVGEQARNSGKKLVRMLGKEVTHSKRVLDVSYDLLDKNKFGLSIHRAILFDLLFEAVKKRGIKIHTGFTVKSSAENKLISIEGEQSEVFDFIIDASGANSILSPLKSKKLSYGAVWGTVDWPDTDLRNDWLTL